MLCLFDLDGTLIDSEDGITRSVQHALSQLGVPAPDDLRAWIGPPLRHNFAPLLDHDPIRIEQAVAHYHERFQHTGWREHTVYAGIDALIEQLHEAGHQLAIVTSKTRENALPIIEQFSFGRLFTKTYTPTPDSAHSEKASMIAAALRDFAAAPGDTVMIGDRCFDIEGALANQVRGIGVLWGFGSRAELEQAGAAALARDPAHLVELLGV